MATTVYCWKCDGFGTAGVALDGYGNEREVACKHCRDGQRHLDASTLTPRFDGDGHLGFVFSGTAEAWEAVSLSLPEGWHADDEHSAWPDTDVLSYAILQADAALSHLGCSVVIGSRVAA